MNIGFDLDRVLINYPPFIPASLINYLYKSHDQKELNYRIPRSRVEQYIRRLSHFHKFRPVIAENTAFIHTFFQSNRHNLYLISSRYKFLEKLTQKILKRYGIFEVFRSINLNTHNEQPHFFKEKKLKDLNIELYIDDDLDLLKYLHTKCPQVKLLWYNPFNRKVLSNGITSIRDLSEVQKYIK